LENNNSNTNPSSLNNSGEISNPNSNANSVESPRRKMPEIKEENKEKDTNNININIKRDSASASAYALNTLSSISSQKDKEKEKENGIMIICGPNAAPYEIFSYTDKWVEYYLDNGINVLLWNYRGYGESTGNISYENIRNDSTLVVEYLKNEMKYTNVGVHGISLGGIAACYLAG